MGRGRGKRKKHKERKERAMSRSKDAWGEPKNQGKPEISSKPKKSLVWDKGLGAYVEQGKGVSDNAAKLKLTPLLDRIDQINRTTALARVTLQTATESAVAWGKRMKAKTAWDDAHGSRYKDPMNGDFDDSKMTEGGSEDDGDHEVCGGDLFSDDFDEINKAAAKHIEADLESIARDHTRASLARGECPKCGNEFLTRRIAANGDVLADCGDCRSSFVDDDFSARNAPAPKGKSEASLSDLAAGRYGGSGGGSRGLMTKGATVRNESQGDLWGGYGDKLGGYGGGSGYGGYNGGYTSQASWNTVFKPRVPKTSVTDPLKVDFIPEKVHARSGRLGMTFAPGKRHFGMSADHERDLDLDLKTLCQMGVNTIVCLIEDHEFDSLKVPDLLERAQEVGIDTIWHPVHDYGVPHDTEAFLDLLNAILDDLEAGKTVVVHCKGGLGRTGTVVASTLVALGWDPKDAIEHTRKARKGTVENLTQENFVFWIDNCFE